MTSRLQYEILRDLFELRKPKVTGVSGAAVADLQERLKSLDGEITRLQEQMGKLNEERSTLTSQMQVAAAAPPPSGPVTTEDTARRLGRINAMIALLRNNVPSRNARIWCRTGSEEQDADVNCNSPNLERIASDTKGYGVDLEVSENEATAEARARNLQLPLEGFITLRENFLAAEEPEPEPEPSPAPSPAPESRLESPSSPILAQPITPVTPPSPLLPVS